MGSTPNPRHVSDRNGKSHTSAAPRSSRCIALVGPYFSGKTTLLEAILARTGAITRQGKISDKNTTGDASPEARAHGMSTELNIADVTFLNDHFTFIDCPGSIEFQTESAAVLATCDAAVVVCEPDEKRVPALQLILKSLEDRSIPHLLFLNKIDCFEARVRDIVPMLQPASTKPLVLRQVPIWTDGVATGVVDLASERAYLYRPHAESQRIDMPTDMKNRESEARFQMLEKVADFDDDLMEQLLNDQTPATERVFDDLRKELHEGLICPVFLGSAENGNGIVRLLKALRHEAPFVDQTARRLKLENARSAVQIVKTIHTPHGGKMSVARVLTGEVADGSVLNGENAEERVAGVFSLIGETVRKRATAMAGDTVALGRLEKIGTAETLTVEKGSIRQAAPLVRPDAVYAQAIELKERKDEVNLSAALVKLTEEDPSLSIEHAKDTHQMVLWGQGEMHLRVTLERLKRKYGVDADTRRRQVPYKETIRAATEIRGRHRKQSGGHGQFGDVVIAIEPLTRGEGFKFGEKIHGGTVPKQFIPSVEIGVADYLNRGPLGFPVVDVGVTLLDGSYHAVDSSDMAFRQAGRLAMSEGMPKCQPVLLEPIMEVEITVPTEATARVNAIIAQRRGQILGFDTRAGWNGWDRVQAYLPESEMADLIIELRSATAGVGTYTANFHHLSELTGRLAEQVIAGHEARAA
jgi:elongation factor G